MNEYEYREEMEQVSGSNQANINVPPVCDSEKQSGIQTPGDSISGEGEGKNGSSLKPSH